MINKKRLKYIKAQSHIETILSFVIFAGFLFTLLIFLNPVSQKSTSTAVLDLAERQIIDNLSISHEKISLILSSPASGSCFYVDNTIVAGNNILVKDSHERIVKSKLDSSKIYIATSLDPDERYYLVYYNSSLNSYPLSNTGVCDYIKEDTMTEPYASWGLHDTDDLVLYENLIAFNNSYNTNYEALKSSLHLQSNFVFSVFNQSNFEIMKGEKLVPSAGNILSRNIPLLAVNLDMNRSDIILNLRVW